MISAQRGYTIIEVLIFLAISGAMFTVAIVGTRGQQDGVALRQGMDSIALKIKEEFNNVDNGYFGNTGNYQCDSTAAADWISVAAGGGSSMNCVFMGKRISFSTTSPNIMNINTILADTKTVNPIQQISSSTQDSRIDEAYFLPNAITFTKSYTTSTDVVGVPASSVHLYAGAIRDTAGSATADLRATRYFYDDTAWPTSPNGYTSDFQAGNDHNLTAVYCFTRYGSKALIAITQKDVIASYNGGSNC